VPAYARVVVDRRLLFHPGMIVQPTLRQPSAAEHGARRGGL